jgi:UDP-N-acetylglucosamine 2-epimerase (non-hydrolysing)
MVIHGDTVSTVMGALLGHKYKMKVAHVEAGLRSFDFLNPFPEEIDRILTSKYARLHFAPSQLAFDNLKKMKGQKFNTQYNTILDSMRYSGTIETNSVVFSELKDEKYFVFVMHRQENLAQKKLVQSVIEQIIDISKSIKCVMILHEITEIKMKEYMLLDTIKKNDTITTTPRMEYFDFIRLLRKSEFVITDGGSNQEELYYMGKPCLVLRKKTERNEGINKNVFMYNEDIGAMKEFSINYNRYKTNGVDDSVSPSYIIAKVLQESMI